MERQRKRGSARAWALVGAAALLLAVAQGFRSSLGLFISPLNTATGLGLVAISFALAASQLAAGLAQPLAATLDARHGTARLVAAGAVLTALGIAVLPWLHSATLLTLGFVAIAVTGTAFASAPILVGAALARIPARCRGRASGLVGAGGSAGQLVVGPAAQAGILLAGWMATLWALAGVVLASAMLARCFRQPGRRLRKQTVLGATVDVASNTRAAAWCDPSLWWLAASFFVCGFHVSFLLAHMPGFIAMCALPATLAGTWLAIVGACNIAGSIGSGVLVESVSPRATLALLYVLRGLVVLVFAALPVSGASVIAFSIAIGSTYMATVPPTTVLIASRYGARNVPILFGVVMLLHQAGSFLGVWLGAVVVATTGSYDAMWRIDAALAFAAALACLGVRERRLVAGRVSSTPQSASECSPAFAAPHCDPACSLRSSRIT